MIEELIDVEIHKLASIEDIGEWLDSNMPNPPLPDKQRWSIGYDRTGTR